jgi:hypothetical protein
MPFMDHIISLITLILITILGLVLQVIGFIDGLLGAALTSAGIPVNAQAPLLIIAAIILAVAALRLLGRFIAFLLLILFLLLLLAPHAPHSWSHIHDQAPTITLPGPHVTM